MDIKPIYEFLVWDNCNNNCRFCFQRENPRLFNHTTREHILHEVITFIDSDRFQKGSHILICGGEIFDKPSDFTILYDFFKQIIDRMNNNTIDLLYLNTNLIYENVSGLFDILNMVRENHLFERLRFTTSYDLEGRFKTTQSENIMLNNLINIKQEYPEIQIVTNTILTKPVCQAIIKGDYNLKQWMEKYHCWVNLVPYIIYDEKLSASREEIFKALYKINEENNGYLKRYILNFDLSQDKLLYMYKDDKFRFCSCAIDDCGHSINFKKYSKTNSCYVCDLKTFFKGEY